MDLFLDWCEHYPFYFLDGDADIRDRKSVSLTDSEYADYKRVMAEFDASCVGRTGLPPASHWSHFHSVPSTNSFSLN